MINPIGQLVLSKDTNGVESTFSYDNLGNILSIANTQSGITQEFDYDKSNNLLRAEQSINGKKLINSYKYDGLGNVIESTNERGETYKLSYKQAGCLCTETSNAKEIIDPNGGVTKFEHDWRGKVIYQIDPKGIKTRIKYDPRGNLADVSVYNLGDTINSKISFAYGANNLLTERSEVVGYATVLNRNTFKNSDPAKDVIVKTLYNYDLAGNLSEKIVTRPASGDISRINYSYNGLNKLISIVSSGYKHNISKTLNYDDSSNLLEIIQNGVKVGFQYDKINRPIVAQTFGDTSGNVKQPASVLKYTYTPGGQVRSMKDANDLELVGYEFDANFYPNLIRSGKHLITLDNDSLGRKTKITYPNNVETTFTFDNYNRLDEMEATKVGSRKYLYDELSNISRIKTESGQFDYAYDQNSSLIGAYYKGSEGINDEKFIWDASGNRLNGTKDPVQNPIKPRPLIINNGLFEEAEPMTSNGVGRFSFIYDMHGNVIKKFDNEANIFYVFEYDADNKLVYAEKFKNDSLELSAKYSYDGLGRRIEKEVTKGSTISRKSYIYNGDNILLEYNTSGTTPDESAKYIGSGAIDDNLMTIRNGKGYFYHKDHLGSISAITNEAGEIVQSSHYSSFGKILSIKDKERRNLGVAKALDQPFYYTGREWDSEIELYYYRARSYDPVSARFIQIDPIGLVAGDTNLYRYVFNNPINLRDPSGKFWQFFIGAAIGAAPGIIAGDYQSAVVGGTAGALGSLKIVGAGISFGIGVGSSLVESYWKGSDFSDSAIYEKALISGTASAVGAYTGGLLKGKSTLQLENLKYGFSREVFKDEVNAGLKAGVGGVVGGGLDLGAKNACGF